MAYYKCSGIKIDNSSIKYDNNGRIYVENAPSGGNGTSNINDNISSSTTTYSSSKIDSLIPDEYELPTASNSTLGGVKVDGTTITINNGVISSTNGGSGGGANINDESASDTTTYSSNKINQLIPSEYTLPTASTTTLGGVKVDGTTITVSNGVISSNSTGGQGASNLSDLSDISIDDVEPQQILYYNYSSNKWENAFIDEIIIDDDESSDCYTYSSSKIESLIPSSDSIINVVANPTETGTEELSKLKVGDTIYSISGGTAGLTQTEANQLYADKSIYTDTNIKLGSGNNISTINSTANIIGNNNKIEANIYNSLILGNNNTISSSKHNTTLIGEGLKTTQTYQTLVGKYNKDSVYGAFVVGTGENDANRKTAFAVTDEGDIYFDGNFKFTNGNDRPLKNVVANPEGSVTGSLSKILIGDDIYSISGSSSSSSDNVQLVTDAVDYSNTEETVIGRWTNNKPLYRQIFSINSLKTDTIIATIEIDEIVAQYGSIYNDDSNGYRRPFGVSYQGGSATANVYLVNNDLKIACSGDSSFLGQKAIIVLEYTKKTDNAIDSIASIEDTLTAIEVNPEDEATEELNKIKIGDTVYNLSASSGGSGSSTDTSELEARIEAIEAITQNIVGAAEDVEFGVAAENIDSSNLENEAGV